VEVELADGSLWSATFFTLANIKAIFEKNHRTGEDGGGVYFWAPWMIIVEQLDQETIEATIDVLLDEDEFEQAFFRRWP
jgi:hypothetical protein